MSTDARDDDIEQEDEVQLFYADFLAFVKQVYKHDSKEGNSPSKKFFKYVKQSPNAGIEKALAEPRAQLVTWFEEHRADLVQGFDDGLLKPKPFLLSITSKIYLPVGTIYNRLTEKQQDDLFAALNRVLAHIATDASDKLKLTALAGEKEQAASSGGGGIAEMLSGLLGGSGGGDGITSLLSDIAGQLKGEASDPNNPETIDADKIGNMVKKLMTDKGPNSFFAKMSNNPAIAKLAGKIGDGSSSSK